MASEYESSGLGEQKIVVDGKIITVPNLSVAEMCKQYRLSDEIRDLLLAEKFETAGAVLEAAEGNLEKAGFKQGQIAELKRALREFLSTKMVVTAAPSGLMQDTQCHCTCLLRSPGQHLPQRHFANASHETTHLKLSIDLAMEADSGSSMGWPSSMRTSTKPRTSSMRRSATLRQPLAAEQQWVAWQNDCDLALSQKIALNSPSPSVLSQ
ncbi:hypothetical protein K438DRAFT_2032204 [Mycena galopus ATCC 62051]|nr:hypothetical protein K438DRAFT_2032204 [Mycena galopus ATCC 62051]